MLGVSQFRRNCAVQNIALAPEAAPPDGARILVLVPHCDDETLGCGGFIAAARRRGLAVRVVFTTNGDGSRSTQIAETMRRLRLRNFQELAALRRREAVSACADLGVESSDVHFLGFPDGGMSALWNTHWHAPFRSPFTRASSVLYADAQTPGAPYCGVALLQEIRAALVQFRPTLVFTTHPADTHGDHWACWAFTMAALESLRLGGCDWAEAAQVRAFLVHRGVWPAPHGYHPTKRLTPPADLLSPSHTRHWTSCDLDEDTRAAKKRALARHDSQMAWTPLYLRGFLRRNEIFETVQRADENSPNSQAEPSVRGVSLVALNDKTATLRVHLQTISQGAPRGAIRLFLRAVSAHETRAWNIEIHQSQTRHCSARARELTPEATMTKDGEFQNWQVAPHASSFDVTVPLAAFAPVSERVTLSKQVTLETSVFASASVVTKTARLKKLRERTQERTEIGVVRLANFSENSAPLLVSRLDSRTTKTI